jgi:PAP2 superfamily
MKKLQLRSLMFALTAAGLVACGGGGDSASTNNPSQPINQSYQASTVVAWNTVAIDAIRTGTLGPPAVARALGMVHTAMFDAWAAYDERALAVSANAPAKRPAAERTEDAKNAAVSVAAYRVLLDLYPAQKDKFDAALKAQGLAPENTGTTDGSPTATGNAAAAALLAFRRVDGSNQANGYADTSAYTPVNTPTAMKDVNYWQPQTFCNGRTPGYLLPHWGTVAPFALANGSAVRPTQGPAKLGEPKFTQQALDLIAISAGLNEYQKTVAEYWADGPASETPPGHWFLFAQSTSAYYRYTLDQDVMLYMILGNAMHDAAIATWDTKRAFNSARPITTIRELFKDQTVKSWVKDKGVVEVKGQDWVPYQPCSFITPPFAEYTSGHSAFSSAAAEILKRYTGSDNNTYSTLIKAGTLKTEHNIPSKDVTITWPTFTAAADEAGMSRRFGGIHFEDGDLVGRKIGRDVADQVWKKALTHSNR